MGSPAHKWYWYTEGAQQRSSSWWDEGNGTHDVQGEAVRGWKVFLCLREGLEKTSHTFWEDTEKMEQVFLELHGNWSRVNGHKLENGKSSKGHDNGKTLEDITQKDCEVSTQISRLLNATEDQKISSVSFQPVRFNFLWIFLALVKYSSASEDRESNEIFHSFLHLAEVEV